MKKKRDFLIVLLIIIFLAVSNVFIYFDKTNIRVSGFSIKSVYDKLIKLDTSTIIFVVQWLLILIVIIIFYVKFLKRRGEGKNKYVNIKVKKKAGIGVDTDLDILYNLLKQKTRLKISVIAKTFKVSNEKALEWSRILENNDLVRIEHFAFSEPEVEIK